MRLIGHLPSESSALTFSDFLYVQGINNQVEHEADGWAVWIHSEDEIEKAREWLNTFTGNPNDPRFQKHAGRASELKAQEAKADQAAREKTFDRSRIFRASAPYGAGGFTLTLIALSVLATGLAWAEGDNKNIFRTLLISESVRGLPEVAKGEIWRLITPIFLHGGARPGQFGILHLFFNMWWLMDLGSMIEARKSSRYLLGQVLLIALVSNLAQWYWKGPLFVGMSGVVYGLLGYVWMKGHFDPFSGLYLHPQTVIMMLIWFFACWFGWIPHVANHAHTAGLIAGMLLGLGSSFLARRA